MGKRARGNAEKRIPELLARIRELEAEKEATERLLAATQWEPIERIVWYFVVRSYFEHRAERTDLGVPIAVEEIAELAGCCPHVVERVIDLMCTDAA